MGHMDQARINELRNKQEREEKLKQDGVVRADQYIDTDSIQDTKFYTIGYQGLKSIYNLKEIMDKHGINLLLDVRSKPNTRRFSKKELEQKFGDTYTSKTEMGGFDHELDQFNEWCEVAAAGIGELIEAANTGMKVMIMCAEKNPDKCHRKYFVAKALEMRGHEVIHL